MDNELNVTYIIFGGHVEMHRYRYLYFVICFIAYILIICSNCSIICLIWSHKSLHEPMYIFIAALLINSVLYSSVIYPKLLIDFLSEKQIILYSACLFQGFIFYTLVYSEFLLLAAMSYDRYVSICKPLQYPTIMRKSTVSFCLVLSWLVPVCETTVAVGINLDSRLCTFTLKGIFCNNLIFKLYCVGSKVLSIFGVVMLLHVSLLPLLFIIFTYTRILLITYGSGAEIRRKASQTCLPHIMVLFGFSCFVAYDVIIARLGSDIPKTASLILTFQVVLYHPLINPVIYGLKMTKISKHLKRLFCQRSLQLLFTN